MYALILANAMLFLSTLSLRRATRFLASLSAVFTISIHALLAESDNFRRASKCAICDFYPRSPCGERRPDGQKHINRRPFLSTLSLRRATAICKCQVVPIKISIHALLAESDSAPRFAPTASRNFYPRSPCGERRESRQPCARPTTDFYPRSPCGERPIKQEITVLAIAFLSTLSLRRATISAKREASESIDFYPRSPCGERQGTAGRINGRINFYPRSPCGERPFLLLLVYS